MIVQYLVFLIDISTCVSDCGVLFYIEILIQDLFGGPTPNSDNNV